MTLVLLTRIGGLTSSSQRSACAAMWETIIWPTLQFSLSSWTTTSRPVRRTDSSIALRSHGTIERKSIRSTLISSPIFSSASRDFSTVLPHATRVTSEPLWRFRATPRGTARTGSGDSCSAQRRCFGIRTIVGSSQCIAVQSRPAASSGVLGMATLIPGNARARLRSPGYATSCRREGTRRRAHRSPSGKSRCRRNASAESRDWSRIDSNPAR